MHVSYDVHSNFAESVRHFFFCTRSWWRSSSASQGRPTGCSREWDKGLFFSHRLPPPFFFHLKAVTKSGFTQQRGVKLGRPRFPPSVCKSPQTQGAAQPLEPQHVILSGFRERKLSRKRSGKKKKGIPMVKRPRGSGLILLQLFYPRLC